MAAPNHAPLNILVCNDDGIHAPGIRALVEAIKPYGNLTVVAPDSPQSGMGHAISIAKPLRLQAVDLGPGVTAYSCNGTPADCIKLANGQVMAQKPDLCVSGINHGANHSISVFYSGTMSAAMEGAFEGIPSIGFSLCDFSIEADFTASQHVVRQVVENHLRNPFQPHTVLNVNIPNVPPDALNGMRLCRMAPGRWVEQFERRQDPYGRDYYWLKGNYHTDDRAEDTDVWALDNGYVSIVPIRTDITDTPALQHLNSWAMELHTAQAR